jgi:putative NIF3 family GTP cyclohydrolase 1 type 2
MSIRNYYNNGENKNLVGKHLSTLDGHGGRAEEHRAEMEQIARMVFAAERQQLLEEIQHQYYIAYQQAIDDFLDALSAGISLFAAGHYETEFPVVPVLKDKLQDKFKDTPIIDIRQENPVKFA